MQDVNMKTKLSFPCLIALSSHSPTSEDAV